MLAVSAPAAITADSDAPPGAPVGWLPATAWVMQRWTPFDEARLYKTLGLNIEQVFEFVNSGAGNLKDLAADRGVNLTAAGLLANRRGHVSAKTYAVLLQRTNTVLTQRHLSEHMLHHPWHEWALFDHLNAIFGPTATRLLASGVKFEQLSQHVAIPEAVLRHRILTALERAAQYGVRIGAMSEAEARYQAHEDLGWIGGLFLTPAQFLRQTAAASAHAATWTCGATMVIR